MKTHLTSTTIRLIRLCVVVAAALLVLLIPVKSHAATLIAPAQGVKLPWVQLRPVVAFDMATGEKPKWVLLATDEGMTKTVRYCRQFGASFVDNGYHWACDRWAIGADAGGWDIIKPVTGGSIYYWQLTYTDSGGVEKKSDVRAFSIEAMPELEDVGAISDSIFGTVVGDGTNLNLGAAAFVNSGLKVTTIRSARLRPMRFSLAVGYSGGVRLDRSYIRIRSKAGTRIIPLAATGGSTAMGTWQLSRKERSLKRRTFRYQAFLRSSKNGSVVRSPVRVLVIKR